MKGFGPFCLEKRTFSRVELPRESFLCKITNLKRDYAYKTLKSTKN